MQLSTSATSLVGDQLSTFCFDIYAELYMHCIICLFRCRINYLSKIQIISISSYEILVGINCILVHDVVKLLEHTFETCQDGSSKFPILDENKKNTGDYGMIDGQLPIWMKLINLVSKRFLALSGCIFPCVMIM